MGGRIQVHFRVDRGTSVSADPTLVPAGTTGAATLTFQSLANPTDIVLVPVELSRGNVFDRTGAAPPAVCAGDCNGDGSVVVSELVTAVRIALGIDGLERCAAADCRGAQTVSVDCLVGAVGAALRGCP